MRPAPFLTMLSGRLRDGVDALGDRFRLGQTAWLMDAQNADGGFAGRRGPSDLYYSAFALRSAALLRLPDPTFYRMAVRYMRRHAPSPRSVVDVVSSLFVAEVLECLGLVLWCDECRDERRVQLDITLERFRRDDGGFARDTDGPSSLYHTFLAMLAGELMDQSVVDGEHVVDLVRSRRGSHGGFADLPRHPVEGTNPTAAAVAILAAFETMDKELAASAAKFLLSMRRSDGGFAAHAQAPVADLLSTFSAMVALTQLDSLCAVKLGDVGRFVRTLADPRGGFPGVRADDEPDTEYTYYGLATLGLLAAQLKRRRPGVPSS